MTFVVDCLRFKSVVLFVSCSGAAVVGAALRRTIGDLVMVMVAVVAGVDKVSIGSTVDGASFVASVPVLDHGVVFLAVAVGTVRLVGFVSTRV